METAERRRNLKESLIVAAEQEIAAHGLAGLRARTLADRIGCAVGAIYNVVADLDEQMRLFGYIEGPLGELLPGISPARRALLARSLFSAVHGLITLGLEEKL